MAGSTYTPILRQRSPQPNSGQQDTLHPLTSTEVIIGRAPGCQIILDSLTYGGVSRRHAKVCSEPEMPFVWQVCDLDSANGTFVNGQRVRECRVLNAGDRIVLGQNGPEFIFDLQPQASVSVQVPPLPLPAAAAFAATQKPGQSAYGAPADVTLSQLFPILSTGRDLTHKAYLIPGIITVIFVVLMFLAVGTPNLFNLVLAGYIAGVAYYFVYQLCGKRKPWWLLVAVGLMTILILLSPLLKLFTWVFRDILPGGMPEGQLSENFLRVLVQMFFGAGLMEELLKALPVLLVYYIGTWLRSPLRETLGVWEPLDGILLGTASAVGFTLLETLGQYVPDAVNYVDLPAQGDLVGLQILIPRILGSISGHMAYSGYLGYFIGLSVLKPSRRWRILAIGYLSAAALHTLWNASGKLSFPLLAMVGVMSYAFLTAAILKARALSPTRSQNFATRFSRLP